MSRVNELFDELLALEADRRRPPVNLWHPDRVGDIDIRIAPDGTWYHEEAPIRRVALVRLFAGILRRDPDGYCLVTPTEKLRIRVEDAPFLATDLEVRGHGADQQLLFLTNVGDAVLAGRDHPVRMGGTAMAPRPYVHVRDELEALIARPVYYRLADLAEFDGQGYWLVSNGARFRLG